jgi:hypothetical protein
LRRRLLEKNCADEIVWEISFTLRTSRKLCIAAEQEASEQAVCSFDCTQGASSCSFRGLENPRYVSVSLVKFWFEIFVIFPPFSPCYQQNAPLMLYCSLLFVTVCVYGDIHCLVKLCLMSFFPHLLSAECASDALSFFARCHSLCLLWYIFAYWKSIRDALSFFALCHRLCLLWYIFAYWKSIRDALSFFALCHRDKEQRMLKAWRYHGISLFIAKDQMSWRGCLFLFRFWLVHWKSSYVCHVYQAWSSFFSIVRQRGREGWPGVSSHGNVVERENFSGFSLGRQSPSEGHDVWSHNCRWRTAKGPGALILGYSKVDQRAFLTC